MTQLTHVRSQELLAEKPYGYYLDSLTIFTLIIVTFDDVGVLRHSQLSPQALSC